MEEKHHEHKAEHHAHHEKHMKMKKSSLWMMISGILAVLLIISVYNNGGFGKGGGKLSAKEAADKAVAYINTNLLQPGTTATASDVKEENNLYRVKLNIGGREYDSYITKDGGLLFPSAVDLTAKAETPAQNTAQPATPTVEKSDKPSVELFVMSHCPYGTQAEKGMIPVAELLGNKINFEIKFVNYAMHGEKEVLEELNQYCIKAEQGNKFLPYLKCFLKAGDGASCLSEAGIDKTKLESCTKKTDAEFKVTENLKNPTGNYPAFLINDKECDEYGVSGSPTLVINGKIVSSARSPAAYLATICSAFNKAPAECEEELSSASPSAGFGYETTGTASASQCG